MDFGPAAEVACRPEAHGFVADCMLGGLDLVEESKLAVPHFDAVEARTSVAVVSDRLGALDQAQSGVEMDNFEVAEFENYPS